MSSPRFEKLSPVPGLGLEGYADELTLPVGAEIAFKLGGPPGTVKVNLSRLIHGDPNPDGPGYREEHVSWGQPDRIEVSNQVTDYGSFVEIPNADALNPTGPFTVGLWFKPTLGGGGWRALAVKWARENLGYGIFFAGERFLTAAVSHDGRTAHWATARENIHVGNWQFVAFSYRPDPGEIRLYQQVGDTAGVVETRSSRDTLGFSSKVIRKGTVYAGNAPLLFGACEDPDRDGGHWAHFTGKIAHPVILGDALDHKGIQALACGKDPSTLGPVIGSWHLGQEVTGPRVVDLSDNRNHGLAVNAPGRAVTGPFWGGMPSRLYTDQPDDYNAIYLHEDDLEDAGWPTTFSVAVPPHARSGIYALRARTDSDTLFVPFIVTSKAPRSELACLIPTLTWQAYGSNRAAFSYTEDGVLDRTLCTYDVHSDGSTVYYYSRLQPTRGWNPGAGFQNWGAHNITANLYLIDWLEAQAFEYDVMADEDLHRGGADLLSGYRCVIMGSHPEYHTETMIDGLAAYVRNGGRLVYLSGNGLYWVVSIDPRRPYLIELRRGGEGDYGPTYDPAPGESQHSTTLELGGLWARRGRPPRRTVGVEHASNAWIESDGNRGFRRLPSSLDARYAWVFHGVGRDEVIGDFGLNLGSAAGFEMDAMQAWAWDRFTPEPVVLARAAHPDLIPARRTHVSPSADVAIMDYAGGGAVFSAGSVTWTGSLSHNGYANNVSTITRNVIRRFLDTTDGQTVLGGAGPTSPARVSSQ
ncbi:MAG: LamG domain-containing protein [Candidatus Latescibacteria bacterium]|nr:LamG domain-containing protein [Candidatus Latescibacterota bacterium]